MSAIDKLTALFIKFPGIGPRQAQRFVYFLLDQDKNFLDNLTAEIGALSKNIRQCQRSCWRYFPATPGVTANLCEGCLNPEADERLLLVVEKDVDLDNIRKSGSYKGKYFVLGGLLPILEEKPAEKIRSRELSRRVNAEAGAGKLKEVIIALSVNPEGENTVDYLKQLLKAPAEKFHLKITLLGRGLSTGSEIEYIDPETIKNALSNRASGV